MDLASAASAKAPDSPVGAVSGRPRGDYFPLMGSQTYPPKLGGMQAKEAHPAGLFCFATAELSVCSETPSTGGKNDRPFR